MRVNTIVDPSKDQSVSVLDPTMSNAFDRAPFEFNESDVEIGMEMTLPSRSVKRAAMDTGIPVWSSTFAANL